MLTVRILKSMKEGRCQNWWNAKMSWSTEIILDLDYNFTSWPTDSISPDNVIRVAQIEPLLALGYVVDHTHSSNEVDHFTRGCVVEVVATLVSTVTVHPLQTELALRSCLVGHGCTIALLGHNRRSSQTDSKFQKFLDRNWSVTDVCSSDFPVQPHTQATPLSWLHVYCACAIYSKGAGGFPGVDPAPAPSARAYAITSPSRASSRMQCSCAESVTSKDGGRSCVFSLRYASAHS